MRKDKDMATHEAHICNIDYLLHDWMKNRWYTVNPPRQTWVRAAYAYTTLIFHTVCYAISLTHVVVLVLWSMKNGRPLGALRTSQPTGMHPAYSKVCV